MVKLKCIKNYVQRMCIVKICTKIINKENIHRCVYCTYLLLIFKWFWNSNEAIKLEKYTKVFLMQWWHFNFIFAPLTKKKP